MLTGFGNYLLELVMKKIIFLENEYQIWIYFKKITYF